VAMDDGGTANGGDDTSEPCTIDIDIICVGTTNTPPIAQSSSVTTSQGVPINITLMGSDPDGDALTYAIVVGPANGTLSGSGSNRVYTPFPGYTGIDVVSFTVNDGLVDSAVATVGITVSSQSNQLPFAWIEAEDLYDFEPSVTNAVVISCTGTNATLKLDGTGSFDTDGDPLTYGWYLEPTPTPFSTNAMTTATLDLGLNTIRLAVTDSKGGVGITPLTVEVLTMGEAINEIIDKVHASNILPGQKRLFVAKLNRAATFVNLGYDPDYRRHRKKTPCWRFDQAAAILWSFERNVWTGLRNRDRDLARCLMNWADNVICAIDNCPCSTP
jgi:hypothetical protein